MLRTRPKTALQEGKVRGFVVFVSSQACYVFLTKTSELPTPNAVSVYLGVWETAQRDYCYQCNKVQHAVCLYVDVSVILFNFKLVESVRQTPLRNFRSQLKVSKFEEKCIRHCHSILL